jgi:hypothetical protein
VLTFDSVPFGGSTIQWSFVVLDDEGNQVGTGVSGPLTNDDPSNPPMTVEFAITELPETVSATSVFERKDTLAGPRSVRRAAWSTWPGSWTAATCCPSAVSTWPWAWSAPACAPTALAFLVYTASLSAVCALLDERDRAPVIVFARTKHGVKKLAQRLGQLGYLAAALQGNLSQNARERVMTDFRAGVVPILVATNVAARGLDVHAVGRVINYELPESAELFTHRASRTGRMGRHGEAVTLLTPDDAERWRQIERALGRRLIRRPWGDSPIAGSAEAPVAQLRPTRRRRRHSGPRGRQNGMLPHASGQRTRRRRVGSAA